MFTNDMEFVCFFGVLNENLDHMSHIFSMETIADKLICLSPFNNNLEGCTLHDVELQGEVDSPVKFFIMLLSIF